MVSEIRGKSSLTFQRVVPQSPYVRWWCHPHLNPIRFDYLSRDLSDSWTSLIRVITQSNLQIWHFSCFYIYLYAVNTPSSKRNLPCSLHTPLIDTVNQELLQFNVSSDAFTTVDVYFITVLPDTPIHTSHNLSLEASCWVQLQGVYILAVSAPLIHTGSDLWWDLLSGTDTGSTLSLADSAPLCVC